MKQYNILLFCILLAISAQAQNRDSLIPHWQIGTTKGYAQIAGEIQAEGGLGFGFYLAKLLRPYWSLGLYLGQGDMRGLNPNASTNWANNPVWNGTRNPAINYAEANRDAIYTNFQTHYQEISLQLKFSFTQLAFWQNKSPWDSYLSAGIGAMRYRTKVDAAGSNGMIYDFAAVNNLATDSKAETLASLSTIFDGQYETFATDNAQITPLFQLGLGIQYRVSPRIRLTLTHQLALTTSDELDGDQWDDNNNRDNQNDQYHFTNIGLSYTLFKRKSLNPTVTGPMIITDTTSLLPYREPPVINNDPVSPYVRRIVRRAFENLEFETNKAIIRPTSFDELNELAALLRDHPEWRLTISGHTDNVGVPEDNMLLSEQRAKAVQDYFINWGLDEGRFEVSWFGEDRPIATNDTKRGRQKNRRVELKIIY